MKKSLVSLGLAAALVVPAGAAYAQSADVTADDTITCQAGDGVTMQKAHGAQNQARLDDGAPYGDPENCLYDGDQARLQTQTRLQDGTGTQARIQSQERLVGDGEYGDPESCPYGGEGAPQSGLGNGGGPGFGRSGS